MANSKGVMSPEDAEQAIWGYFYQHSIQRDRRRPVAGEINWRTGLPESSAGLVDRSRAVTGIKLAMGAWCSPWNLAACSTAWLPPCPADESSKSWGSKEEHWQVMAFKPIEVKCPVCQGTSPDPHIQAMAAKCRPGYEPLPPCEECKGNGSLPGWEEEEKLVVEQNEIQIKLAAHRLAEKGWINLVPVDKLDPAHTTLSWEDDLGFTIGFKLRYEGYQAMLDYMDDHPELKHKIDALTYAGKEVRKQAPVWKLTELERDQV